MCFSQPSALAACIRAYYVQRHKEFMAIVTSTSSFALAFADAIVYKPPHIHTYTHTCTHTCILIYKRTHLSINLWCADVHINVLVWCLQSMYICMSACMRACVNLCTVWCDVPKRVHAMSKVNAALRPSSAILCLYTCTHIYVYGIRWY